MKPECQPPVPARRNPPPRPAKRSVPAPLHFFFIRSLLLVVLLVAVGMLAYVIVNLSPAASAVSAAPAEPAAEQPFEYAHDPELVAVNFQPVPPIPPDVPPVTPDVPPVTQKSASRVATSRDKAESPPPPVKAPVAAPPVVGLPGDHDYFNALTARADHWKSYSLRDKAQIAKNRQGKRVDVDYLFPNDPDPRQQDAAKVVIPDFPWVGWLLAKPMSERPDDDTLMSIDGLKTGPGTHYKIDNEVLLFREKIATGGVRVWRGQHGTAVAAHAAGAKIGGGVNSILSQVYLPMGAEDGHSYLTTWDAWYGKETKSPRSGLSGWKNYQFGPAARGLEVRTRFNYGSEYPALAADEVGVVDMRAYLALGPGIANEPIRPMLASFPIKAETWTRYWVLMELIPGDWNRLSLWMADPTRGPVQILNRTPFEEDSARFDRFILEFCTSKDAVAPNRGPLVSYVRNVVMLRDVAKPATLLLRPTAGGAPAPAPASPNPPKNLAIPPAP